MSSIRWSELHITYDLDLDLIEATSRTPIQVKIRRFSQRFFGLLVAGQLLMTCMIWIGCREPRVGLIDIGCGLSLVLLAVVVFWSFRFWSFRRRAYPLERIEKSPRRELRLTPQGIAGEALDGWSFLGWSFVSRVDETDRHVSVEFKNDSVLLFPKSSLPASTQAEFMRVLREFPTRSHDPVPLPDFVMAKTEGRLLVADVNYSLSASEIEKQSSVVLNTSIKDANEVTKRKSPVLAIVSSIMVFLASIVLFASGGESTLRLFILGLILLFLSWMTTILLALQSGRLLYKFVLTRAIPTDFSVRLYYHGIVIKENEVWNSFNWDRVQSLGYHKDWIGVTFDLGNRLLIPKSAFVNEVQIQSWVERIQQLHRDFVPVQVMTTAIPDQADMANPYAPPRATL